MRLEIVKRIPIAAGMAGGSADAAAALRLAAEAAELDDRRWLEDIAAGLGADVPSQVRGGLVLATGVGARLRRLEDRLDYSVIVLPVAAELSAGAVYEEADRLGLARDTLGLARSLTRVQAALSSETVLDRVHNDLQDAARSLCPAIDDGARGRPRGRGRPRDRLRIGPHGARALQRGGPPRARPRDARGAHRRGSLAGTDPDGAGRPDRVAAARAARRGRRRAASRRPRSTAQLHV